MADKDLFDDDDNDDDSDIDILIYMPFWYGMYDKVYKSRDRRYFFIERKDEYKNE